MKVTVGLSPRDEIAAPLGVVIDVLRATSVICQAFAAGFEQIVCVGEVDEARSLARVGVALGGERHNVRPEGFDYGNSPREFAAGAAPQTTLVQTTTNGTRLLLAAAARCDAVIVGSLLNLDAVVRAVAASRVAEVALLCAGVEGRFAVWRSCPASSAAPRRASSSRSRFPPGTQAVKFSWARGSGSYSVAARPNGVPSESRQIAQRPPGWTTSPPSERT